MLALTRLLTMLVLLLMPWLAGCAAGPALAEDAGDFTSYWFAGEAELNRYRLEQARYGEIHEGDAVLVFVTEDFLPDRQVKSEDADRARSGAWPVLKLNFTRNFLTGVYPYSMMTSVFTPIDREAHPTTLKTLKTTTSVQEWCGHTWLQLNLRDGRYEMRAYSYFESEGDRRGSLDAALLEDELWTRVRLAPDSLPTGKIELIPGAQQSRLRHRELGIERAVAELDPASGGRERVYTVRYPDTGRTLAIRFGADFPHEILGWEDTYGDLTTRATRTHVTRLPYWRHNRNTDRPLRDSLGLGR